MRLHADGPGQLRQRLRTEFQLSGRRAVFGVAVDADVIVVETYERSDFPSAQRSVVAAAQPECADISGSAAGLAADSGVDVYIAADVVQIRPAETAAAEPIKLAEIGAAVAAYRRKSCVETARIVAEVRTCIGVRDDGADAGGFRKLVIAADRQTSVFRSTPLSWL